MDRERQGGTRRTKKPDGEKQGGARLLVMLGIGAVLVAGTLVALGALAGGSREDLGGIPQNGTTLGDAGAPVTIQLYEDFQCPACGQFARETLPEVVDTYVRPGEAKLVSETLAFLGDDSVTAARAALAAGEQDRYWPFALLLFENQGAENSGYVTDEFLTDQAEEVEGLDVEQWQEDRSQSYEDELQAVGQRANEAGVNSTPSLLISGPDGERLLRGAVPIEEVERAVEEVR